MGYRTFLSMLVASFSAVAPAKAPQPVSSSLLLTREGLQLFTQFVSSGDEAQSVFLIILAASIRNRQARGGAAAVAVPGIVNAPSAKPRSSSMAPCS